MLSVYNDRAPLNVFIVHEVIFGMILLSQSCKMYAKNIFLHFNGVSFGGG